MTAGFDGLAGAGAGVGDGAVPVPPVAPVSPVPPVASAVPAGVRAVPPPSPGATRMVLIRHGEAVCNVSGVCGGPVGCGGLTGRGRRQVEVLVDRLRRTGELAGAGALYASVLPRAVETAELLAPALGGAPGGADSGRSPRIVTDCGLCEVHPGAADGLTWADFAERFPVVDWDEDPDRPIAPGGESWTGFVRRVDAALDEVADRHPGQLVVVACHAGVIEASMLAKLPVAGGTEGARLGLQTRHASMTGWEVDGGRWRLLGYNDTAHGQTAEAAPGVTSGAVPETAGADTAVGAQQA